VEPVTAVAAVKAGLSIYEAGGLVLLLIVFGVVGVALMARWFMGIVRDLGLELTKMRGEIQTMLLGVIQENTRVNQELRGDVQYQTSAIIAQTEAMRGRPCLIESGIHPRPHLPTHPARS